MKSELAKEKARLRREAYDRRNAEPNKDQASQRATDRLLSLNDYQAANLVLWYIDCRSELRTSQTLKRELQSEKQIAVPYCTVDAAGNNALGLWRLREMQELIKGKWKILEPPPERWEESDRQVEPQSLDLVVVPGVAFTKSGARLGNGQGYYDHLLSQIRPDCISIGLCYESQLVPSMNLEQHDRSLDVVITEAGVYRS